MSERDPKTQPDARASGDAADTADATSEKNEPLATSDESPDSSADSKESDAMRALLKRSLASATPASTPERAREPGALLRGVQKKIRQRSKGKFYADGWSTTQSKVNYALIAVIMLVLIGAIYFVMGPTGISIAPR